MPITRFAPSPTGLLHLGHAFAALTAWRRARAGPAGKFLLRIEDLDATRCRPAYIEAIQKDLDWLGLDWNGPIRFQSRCFDDYRAALRRLDEQGLLYPCFCSRADIAAAVAAPHGPDGAPLYPGTCRTLSPARRADLVAAGAPHALRLDMARAVARVPKMTFTDETEGQTDCHPEAFGDVVLARKDAPASYHLCVTHDDAVQGVTLVTRGRDLLPATHLHRLLQALLGYPEPGYAHHRLITDEAGRRLSKRDRDTTLASLRAQGVTPDDIRSRLL